MLGHCCGGKELREEALERGAGVVPDDTSGVREELAYHAAVEGIEDGVGAFSISGGELGCGIGMDIPRRAAFSGYDLIEE